MAIGIYDTYSSATETGTEGGTARETDTNTKAETDRKTEMNR